MIFLILTTVLVSFGTASEKVKTVTDEEQICNNMRMTESISKIHNNFFNYFKKTS